MRFRIVIIGAGRLSYSLTSALINAKYSVDAVISKKIASARALAKKNNIKNYSNDPESIPETANIFLLTVPDGEISSVAKMLVNQKLPFGESYFMHFSGTENIKSLQVLKRKGGKIASLHLMQTFPSKRVVKLQNVPAAIETENENDYKILKKFALKLNLSPFKIKSEYKPFYHLAGVYSLNFLAGNLFTAKEMLKLNKIGEKKYFEILNTSLASNMSCIKKVGPANALSGPVDRGDLKTLKMHIASIKKLTVKKGSSYFGTVLKNYLIQSLHLLYLVEEKYNGLKESHIKIRNLLEQELKKLEKSG